MKEDNVFWSRGLSLVYLGTKYLVRCSSVQIGAGTLSSGNPPHQNKNPYGLATTLWSKREGFSYNFKSTCRCTIFYFFKNDNFSQCSPMSPFFISFYKYNYLILESRYFICTWGWFEYVGRRVCFLSDQQLWLNCMCCDCKALIEKGDVK